MQWPWKARVRVIRAAIFVCFSGSVFQGPASRSLWNRPKAIRGKEDMPLWWRNKDPQTFDDIEEESEQPRGRHVPVHESQHQ